MESLRAVCFDVGGTLVDGGPGRKRRLAELAGVDPEAIDAAYRDRFLTRDWGEAEALAALADDLGDPTLPARAGRLRAAREPRLYPDVRPALAALRGLRLVVITNCSSADRDWFEGTRLRESFEACFYSCELGSAKPDRRVFAAVQERLGLEPAALAHVGDHPVGDVAGAADAGWLAIHLRRDARTAEAPRAGLVCRNLLELAVRVSRTAPAAAPRPPRAAGIH